MNYKILKNCLLSCLLVISFTAIGQAASITGAVNYEGDVPKFPELKMDADPICITQHSSPVYPEALVLGDNKELANVFVYVKSGLATKEYPAPSQEVVLNQKGCIYEPHVLGVMVGQPLKILNPDGTLHNVHSGSKINPEFNIAMPKFRKEIIQTFDKVEFMFPLKCDVHPWMASYLSVMDHPFFNVTDKAGAFALNDLPAGTYTIEAWHEKLPAQTMEVTLAEGESKAINFILKKPSK